MQLSAMSVPLLSALSPPKDGMTLPPAACSAEMSLPKFAEESGSLVSPSQYAVHEPVLGVCMNA